MLDVVPPSARSDDLKWYRANLFKVGSMTIEWYKDTILLNILQYKRAGKIEPK